MPRVFTGRKTNKMGESLASYDQNLQGIKAQAVSIKSQVIATEARVSADADYPPKLKADWADLASTVNTPAFQAFINLITNKVPVE